VRELENLVKCQGSLVLDPSCGRGTAVDAAQRLGRKWIGIDIPHVAVNLVKVRLRNPTAPMRCSTWAEGSPPTLQALKNSHRTTSTSSSGGLSDWSEPGRSSGRTALTAGSMDACFFQDEQGDKTKQAILSVKAGHVNVCTCATFAACSTASKLLSVCRSRWNRLRVPCARRRPRRKLRRTVGGYPRMHLTRKVAKDRVISTVDFEARHGHKVRFRLVTAT
jgi:hypothetical protein